MAYHYGLQDFTRSLRSTGEGREVKLVLASACRSVRASRGWVSEGWSFSAGIGYH